MIQGMKGVKYGLTLPASKKKAAPPVKQVNALAAFGDDDDGEHEAVPQQLARQAASKKSNNKVAEVHAAALEQDASVFDYDGVFDSMQEAKVAPVRAARAQRSSKYIEGLLDKAKERQREQDIVYERRQVKERQVEDHLFGDKEKFVTAAYKKELQERQLWEARQKIKDQRDEDNAAEKVGDMSGFYGNLLTKNVAFGTKGAKQAAEKQAEKDDAAFTAATSQPAVGAPAGAAAVAAAASPSQPDEGPDTDSREPSATVKAPATATLRQPDASSSPAASDRAHREPSGQAPPSDKAPDDSVGGTEAAMGAPAAPKPAVPVRHTDDSAKAAARERYLARKKRKAEEAPEPLPS